MGNHPEHVYATSSDGLLGTQLQQLQVHDVVACESMWIYKVIKFIMCKVILKSPVIRHPIKAVWMVIWKSSLHNFPPNRKHQYKTNDELIRGIYVA